MGGIRLKAVRTTLFAMAAAFVSVCWFGCGDKGGGNPSAGGNDDPGVVIDIPTVCPNCGEDYSLEGADDSLKWQGGNFGNGELDGSRDPYENYMTTKLGGKRWQKYNLFVAEAGKASWDYGIGYGRLYTWDAAKSACQSIGMRLPTVADWQALIRQIGEDAAGYHLKSYTKHTNDHLIDVGYGSVGPWNTSWGFYSQVYSDDMFGFSAQPGGWRDVNGTFEAAGYYGYWWTADESGKSDAYYYQMGWNYDDVRKGAWKKDVGYSVRCIKDV
jgi:uncharacterized protein (TIGR02145 family)